MTEQSPALKLEARANREHAKIAKERDELRVLAGIVEHSELQWQRKRRLLAAFRVENDELEADERRNDEQRRAALISRSKQWVTSGDG